MWLSNRRIQAAFVHSPGLRTGSLALVLLLFLGSLFGLWEAFNLPKEKKTSVVLANYQHQGNFDYLVYVDPGYLFGPAPPGVTEAEKEEKKTPVYFTNIITDIETRFTYGFAPDYPSEDVSSNVDLVAIIHGPSGWQKEVPILSTTQQGDYFTIPFPLELDTYNDIINDVEEELGFREVTGGEENAYSLVIEARVKVKARSGTEWIEDTFAQPMEIRVGRGTLGWDNNLTLVRRRCQGAFTYKHIGNFDYAVYLEPNTALYGEKIQTLRPEPYQRPQLISRPPGEVYFTKTADIMKASFGYRLECDQLVTNLTEEVKITAILEYPPAAGSTGPPMWQKTFTLVPATRKSGNFVVEFPVDVNYFNGLVNLIRGEIGMGAPTNNLTIRAEVRTQGDTRFGRIDKVFTQDLKGILGGATVTWDTELQKSEKGTIGGTRTVSDPNVGKYQMLSLAVLALVLFGFVFVVWNFSESRSVTLRAEEEAFRVRKKHKNVIVDVTELPVAKPEETVIPVGSLDELIKAADNLLKPVLHQAEADKHTYCVIDGLTRYQYVSQL